MKTSTAMILGGVAGGALGLLVLPRTLLPKVAPLSADPKLPEGTLGGPSRTWQFLSEGETAKPLCNPGLEEVGTRLFEGVCVAPATAQRYHDDNARDERNRMLLLYGSTALGVGLGYLLTKNTKSTKK